MSRSRSRHRVVRRRDSPRDREQRKRERSTNEKFGQVDEPRDKNHRKTEHDPKYDVICIRNNKHLLSQDVRMTLREAKDTWGKAHIKRVDEKRSIAYFDSACCNTCRGVERNCDAIISELKRVYRPGETSVTVQDVYFFYDNIPLRGDFHGKVYQLNIKRITEDCGKTYIEVITRVELFPRGHANDKSFRISGMYPHADKPHRTVEWKNGRALVIIKDEIEVVIHPQCIKNRVDRIFPGTHCKRTCPISADKTCSIHTLKRCEKI